MKKLLFIVVVLFAFGLWVMLSPPEDGGYLLIAYGSKTIEMSLWFAALVIILSIFVAWLVLRLWLGSFY
ncbi:MAG TPA: heme biosynthesis HemY N-terminal domain-containing protein, partial [Cellvibrio sp.]|nr:heme biosynthesis HemY N-terminal domain-containing protein [Cellvibrio sp.]